MDSLLQNNAHLQALRQRSYLQAQRAETSRLSDFKLAPFIGLRVRGDRFSQLGTAPEAGLRFSLPVAFFQKRSNRQQQRLAETSVLAMMAEEEAQRLQAKLNSLYDRWLNVETKIAVVEQKLAAWPCD